MLNVDQVPLNFSLQRLVILFGCSIGASELNATLQRHCFAQFSGPQRENVRNLDFHQNFFSR